MSAVEARGFVGDVPDVKGLVALVRDVAREADASVQVLRGDRVFSRAHVMHAVDRASLAFAEGRNRSGDLALEILAYAAGDRQLSRALDRLGVAAGTALPLVAVAVGPGAARALDLLASRAGWRREAAVLDGPKDVATLEALGIDAALRASVPRGLWEGLVLERVALADLPKG